MTSVRRVISHLRWWIAAALFASTIINYLDRQTLSLLAPFLKVQYHWSNTDYAYIVIAFRVAYAICFVLSILYSVPPFRFKAVAGVDWVINMWGFGTLTPFAAWAATGRPLDAGHALVLLGFCPLFAGLYPLTQLYQMEEDRRRGDRTLALLLGLRASLGVAIACTALAFALFGWAAIVLGVRAWLLVVPLVAWVAVLVPWYRRREALPPPAHQRGMYRALAAWAVTDLVVLLVFAR